MGTLNSQADLAAHSKAKPNRVWIAVILGILSGIGPVVIDLYLPGLPQMATDLHTNASVVQLSLTSCLLGWQSAKLSSALSAMSLEEGFR